MAERHPGTVGLLRWFEYAHLPAELGVVSMQFHHLAHELVDRTADGPELTTALRKLLESKDAAVRATIETGAQAPASHTITVTIGAHELPQDVGGRIAQQLDEHRARVRVRGGLEDRIQAQQPGPTQQEERNATADRSAAEQSDVPRMTAGEDVRPQPPGPQYVDDVPRDVMRQLGRQQAHRPVRDTPQA